MTTMPSLALVHGWGFPAQVWTPLQAVLPTDRSVLTPPLPGYAETPLPATAADAADALITGLRTAGAVSVDGIVLVGWSLGAQVAMHAAARHPDAVHALVLIAATPRFLAAPDWPHGIAADVLEAFIAALAEDPSALLTRFAALINQGDARARDIRRHLVNLVAAKPPAPHTTLLRGLEWLRDSDLRPLLPAITQPTLLIHGDADPLMPVAAAHWLAERWANARVEALPAVAHAPFLADPAAVAAAITRFLAESSR